MDDEIDCRNVLFAVRKSLRLLSRNTLVTHPISCSQQKNNAKTDFNEFMVQRKAQSGLKVPAHVDIKVLNVQKSHCIQIKSRWIYFLM